MKPSLIVVAGPNGSGKTTITEKLLRHDWMSGCTYINPDIIAQEKFGGWNSSKAVIKAAQYAAKLREQCLADKKNMAFETVFSIQDKLDFILRAKQAGFFVRFFFICTDDPSINAQRIAIRVMEGGHDVPITKIIERYYRSISNSVKAIDAANRAYFYDNSINDCNPKLLFRTAESRVVKIYNELNPWATDIVNVLHKQDNSDSLGQ